MPPPLRFDGSCAPGLPGGSARVLRDHDDASVRSVIARRGSGSAAVGAAAAARSAVRNCVAARPAADALGETGVRASDGRARVIGVLLGDGRMAKKVEYVVVARSGRAVEVATFHVYAQDATPPSVPRDLGRRLLHRLTRVG